MKPALLRTRWYRKTSCAHSLKRLCRLASSCVLLAMATVLLSINAKAQDAQAVEQAAIDDVAEPIIDGEISTVPQIDIPRDLQETMQRQFEQIRNLEEQEDAYSERLGEAYLGYGKSLAKVGRLNEARKLFAATLHLTKINNGLYAIEQRDALRAMFEIYDVQGNVEEMESTVQQLIWLENKNPDAKDQYSFDLVVRLGTAFIELYYSQPRYNEISLGRINKALRYLNYAVKNYQGVPLSERQPPYGEVALLYYLDRQVSIQLGQIAVRDFSRNSVPNGFEKKPKISASTGQLGKAMFQLIRYLDQAKSEENIEHQVRALRDLGDLHLLFDRKEAAAEYYRRAWFLAADLEVNHELVKAFDMPMKIPSFNYATDLNAKTANQRVVRVPMEFSLFSDGRVKKVHTSAKDGGPYPKLVTRARRALKGLVFRPAIENGEMIVASDAKYDTPVRLRKGEEVAQLEITQ